MKGAGPSEPLDAFLPVAGLETTPFSRLAPLTTWKVGGPARFLGTASSREAALGALEVARRFGLPLVVLGNGSNVLFADSGFPGLVLKMSGELAAVSVEGELLAAGAGAGLPAVSRAAMRAGLEGLEFAGGIPGTVGGAVMTNAGAFGASTADVLESVSAVDADGREHELERFEGSYRRPLAPEGTVILRAVFRLRPGGTAGIRSRMKDMMERRRMTQPVAEASAGSVFRNPEGGSAGRLIDECGLKGRRVGGASISLKHANFIVNEGGASAADVRALMELAAAEVLDRFGVRLQPEVKLYGFEEE